MRPSTREGTPPKAIAMPPKAVLAKALWSVPLTQAAKPVFRSETILANTAVDIPT